MAGSEPLIGVEEDTGDFYAISTADASIQFIGHSGVVGLGALEYNPHDGYFYGFTTGEAPEAPVLFRFNIPTTLDAVTPQSIGRLGLSVFEGGLAFAPDGTAYAMNGGVTVPYLLTLDLNTGRATVVERMADRHDIAGLGWRSDGVLIGLDSTDNALLAIDPATAAASTIDSILPTIGGVGGLALLDGGGYFVTGGPLADIPGSNELYSFDAFTGEYVLIGSFEDVIVGSGFSGLSVVPEPATLTLLAIAGAALLRRTRRSIL
jgi:hypothetical protein